MGYLPVESAVADTAYYSDEGLPPLTRYFYRVTSVDLSGHESLPSDSFLMSTSPGTLAGWPVSLDLPNGNAPTIEELNGFGTFEVLAASDAIYAFGADGSDYYDGDLNDRSSPGSSPRPTSPSTSAASRRWPMWMGTARSTSSGFPTITSSAAGQRDRNADLTAFDRFGCRSGGFR
ncbi:MAG: hypothetical protein R3E12_12735 [Candidatus Eisenbacteria bacterium]